MKVSRAPRVGAPVPKVEASSSSHYLAAPHTLVDPVPSCCKSCTGDESTPSYGRHRAGGFVCTRVGLVRSGGTWGFWGVGLEEAL